MLCIYNNKPVTMFVGNIMLALGSSKVHIVALGLKKAKGSDYLLKCLCITSPAYSVF